MKKILSESELIINPDGSIYHLGLLPQDIAKTIIFVGDQERVEKVTQYFDSIELTKQVREFKTQTGYYNKQRISVISTGIGTDNIDIVLNELDALVNIDFSSRTVKDQLTSLNIIRIGTSGTIQSDIPVDSFLLSSYGLGLDGLINYYRHNNSETDGLLSEIIAQLDWPDDSNALYLAKASTELNDKLHSEKTLIGITTTANGFYGPQGRILRLNTKIDDLNAKLANFKFDDVRITNLEMETAGILGLGSLLGHKCASMNALLANRATKDFSKNPSKTVDELIRYTLDKLTE